MFCLHHSLAQQQQICSMQQGSTVTFWMSWSTGRERAYRKRQERVQRGSLILRGCADCLDLWAILTCRGQRSMWPAARVRRVEGPSLKIDR